MINRTNYEIWITDWLDGNLNDHQATEFFSFLDQNPDLKKELENLSGLRLKTKLIHYPGKSNLKRSASDITDDQFDYMCVASLENDLSPEQRKELEDISETVPERKKSLLSFQKIKLQQPHYTYKGKNSLKKKTILQKTLLPFFSAAATIALIITAYLLYPFDLSQNKMAITDHIPDPLTIYNSTPLKSRAINSTQNYLAASVNSNIQNYKGNTNTPVTAALKSETNDIQDYQVIADYPDFQTGAFNNIQISFLPEIAGLPDHIDHLISYNPDINLPENTRDDRNRVERFFARTYRQVVLKEEDSNLPLKRYELAQGGITGINRLLGWNMTLQATNDENGTFESFYFSSKILKFNVPVKNPE